MAELAVIGRFRDEGALLTAARAARQRGLRACDAFTPYPVEGLAEALAPGSPRLPRAALGAGLLGAAAVFALQSYAAYDYPFVVGGKPLWSWPAFLPAAFEAGVLAAVLTALVGMLLGNRLPRLHHPVFDWDDFERASDDGFFLLLGEGDLDTRRALLEEHAAVAIREVDL